MFRKVTSLEYFAHDDREVPFRTRFLSLLNTKVLKTWRNRQKVIDLRAAGGRYFGYKSRPPLLTAPKTESFTN